MLEAGAAKRQREMERDLAMAWHTANFQRGKDLRRLDYYLARLRQKQPQTGAEMIGSLKAIQAKGAPMNIRYLN